MQVFIFGVPPLVGFDGKPEGTHCFFWGNITNLSGFPNLFHKPTSWSPNLETDQIGVGISETTPLQFEMKLKNRPFLEESPFVGPQLGGFMLIQLEGSKGHRNLL